MAITIEATNCCVNVRIDERRGYFSLCYERNRAGELEPTILGTSGFTSTLVDEVAARKNACRALIDAGYVVLERI